MNIYNKEIEILSDVAVVTYCAPRRPNNELLSPLGARGFMVKTVGDCHAPRSVLMATREGYDVGSSI